MGRRAYPAARTSLPYVFIMSFLDALFAQSMVCVGYHDGGKREEGNVGRDMSIFRGTYGVR